MAHMEKITTEIRYEGGKTTALFETHPPIDLVGLSKVKEIPEAWSAPHLLVAATEGCFFLTVLALAKKMHINIQSYSSTAEGTLTSADGKHEEIGEIIIRPTFHLENEADRLRLKLLVEKSEEYCYVTRSLKTKVRVEI